jgi:hypothetical protein
MKKRKIKSYRVCTEGWDDVVKAHNIQEAIDRVLKKHCYMEYVTSIEAVEVPDNASDAASKQTGELKRFEAEKKALTDKFTEEFQQMLKRFKDVL